MWAQGHKGLGLREHTLYEYRYVILTTDKLDARAPTSQRQEPQRTGTDKGKLLRPHKGERAVPRLQEAGPEARVSTTRDCALPSCSKTASLPAVGWLATQLGPASGQGVARPWRPRSPVGTRRGLQPEDLGPAGFRAAWQELRGRPLG